MIGIPIKGDTMVSMLHKGLFDKVPLFQFSFHSFFVRYSQMGIPLDEVIIIIFF